VNDSDVLEQKRKDEIDTTHPSKKPAEGVVGVETEDPVQKAEAPIANPENDKDLKVLNKFLEFLEGDGWANIAKDSLVELLLWANIHRDRATRG
jgi:hypothetical protein